MGSPTRPPPSGLTCALTGPDDHLPGSGHHPSGPGAGSRSHVRLVGPTCTVRCPRAEHSDMRIPHDETTTFNVVFPAPASRKVTTKPTRFVHPHSWFQPTKTPTFPHQHAEKSPLQQHVVSNNPKSHHKTNTICPSTPFCPLTRKSPQTNAFCPSTPENTKTPALLSKRGGHARRRRDLNPRGAMHPYLLSREAHSTGLCDVSSADYFRTFSPRTRTAPAAHTRKRIGMAEGEGFEPPVPLLTQRFSRPSLSAAQTALQTWFILQDWARGCDPRIPGPEPIRHVMC